MTNRLSKNQFEKCISIALLIFLLIFSMQAFAQEIPSPQGVKADTNASAQVSPATETTTKLATNGNEANAPTPTTESVAQDENGVTVELQNLLDNCLGAPTSRKMKALVEKKSACEKAIVMINAGERKGGTESNEIELGKVAVEKELEKLNDDLPDNPLSENSNWSWTVPVFTSLIRVQLGNKKDGTSDQFLPLTGIGSGIKLRHSKLDRNGKPMETLGLSLFSYFEPAVKTSNPDGTAQTLSLGLLFTTIQYFGIGLGYKFVSNEPEYERWKSRNVMILLGIGVDGSTLTP